MWKEVVVTSFKVLSENLPGVNEKNKRKKGHNQDSHFLGRDVKLGPPEYKAGVLAAQPQ
jgi:hypothetical protein